MDEKEKIHADVTEKDDLLFQIKNFKPTAVFFYTLIEIFLSKIYLSSDLETFTIRLGKNSKTNSFFQIDNIIGEKTFAQKIEENIEKFPMDNESETGTVTFHGEKNYNGKSKKVISFHFVYTGEMDFRFSIEAFSLENWDQYDVKTLLNCFAVFYNNLMENLENSIGKIEIISSKEYSKHVLIGTESPIEEITTIPEMLAHWSERIPQKIALRYNGVELTYKELEDEVARLSDFLKNKVKKKEAVIGVMLSNALDRAVAILSIQRAGLIYLAIPEHTPEERIAYIVKNSNCQLLFLEEKSNLIETELISFKQFENGELQFEKNNNFENGKTDKAYIIYSSGTTGQPKGILCSHKSFYNLVRSSQEILSPCESDIFSWFSNPGFDASILELGLAIFAGGTLCIFTEKDKSTIQRIVHFIKENKVTLAYIPTIICEKLPRIEGGNIRYVWTGGDKLKSIQNHLNCKIVNNYGPTECTILCANSIVSPQNITIGTPVHNCSAYILNQQGNILPKGRKGILAIVGTPVSMGYVNTKKSSVFKSDLYTGKRMYITGDICNITEDNEIQFFGREDDQVQINGYRIELNEIEEEIKKVEGIKDVVVLKVEETYGSQLVSFIKSVETVPREKIIKHLKERIPFYMIPQRYHLVEEMPVTPNGKLDKKKLLVELANPKEHESSPEINRKNIENSLITIFQSILHQNSVRVTDNFFELGGNSLAAMSCIQQIEEKLDVTITLADLFESPTIIELSNIIEKSEHFKNETDMVYNEVEENQQVVLSEQQIRDVIFKSLQEVFPGLTFEGKENFFEIGGSSLIAMKLIGICEEKHVYLTIVDIFEQPTINELISSAQVKNTQTLNSDSNENIVNKKVSLTNKISHLQRNIYFIQQFSPNSTQYNMPFLLELQENVNDREIFKNITILLNRHSSLRTNFKIHNGEIYQVINQVDNQKIGLSIQESIEETFSSLVKPFNLERDLLFRMEIVYIDEKRYLFIDMHHSIADGNSIHLLLKELSYLIEGGTLTEMPKQYINYSDWENQQEKNQLISTKKKYWENLLKEPFKTKVPSRILNEKEDSSDEYQIIFDKMKMEKINQFVKAKGRTLFSFLFTVNALVLWEIFGRENVIVGIPTDVRNKLSFTKTVGMFVNVLPIKISADISQTFEEFWESTQYQILQAMENQEYAVSSLYKDGLENRQPLISFSLDEYFIEEVKKSSCFKNVILTESNRKFPLECNARIEADGITFSIYHSELFICRELIQQFDFLYKQVIDKVMKLDEVAIEELLVS